MISGYVAFLAWTSVFGFFWLALFGELERNQFSFWALAVFLAIAIFSGAAHTTYSKQKQRIQELESVLTELYRQDSVKDAFLRWRVDKESSK